MQHYKTKADTLRNKKGSSKILKQVFLVAEDVDIYICKSSISSLSIKVLHWRKN
jgi:hypothetical protein